MPDKPEFPEGDIFSVPRPQPGGRKVSAEQVETILLERVAKLEEELHRSLYDLANLYQRTGRHADAMEVVNRLEALAHGSEEKAVCYLTMGQLAEGKNDFAAAVDYYTQAYRLEPEMTTAWYFINNNLGYSLNQLGRFAEAEGYCQAAIQIDPKRYNAFKNLGVSLEGQGDLVGAAANFIHSVMCDAPDMRACMHLQDLLARNPLLLKGNPALVKVLEECRTAAAYARKFIDHILEVYNR